MSRAPTFFSSVGIQSVDSSMNMPDHERAHQGAVGRAEAAEGDAGEHQQQQLEAHLELHLLLDAEEDAAEGGEAAAEGPHEQDHPVDVDARRGGQVGVVGHGPHGLADPGVLEQRRHADDHDERRSR